VQVICWVSWNGCIVFTLLFLHWQIVEGMDIIRKIEKCELSAEVPVSPIQMVSVTVSG
jgi:hypothetical protein